MLLFALYKTSALIWLEDSGFFLKTWNVIFIEFIKELNQTAILEMMLSDMLKKQ